MEELLKKIVELQDLAEKRGLEMIYAFGCRWTMYATPERFSFTEEGVEMTFEENTRHDCPDSETITLAISDLMMSDEDWADLISRTKAETETKKLEAIENKKKEDQATKLRNYERLKAELGL